MTSYGQDYGDWRVEGIQISWANGLRKSISPKLKKPETGNLTMANMYYTYTQMSP